MSRVIENDDLYLTGFGGMFIIMMILIFASIIFAISATTAIDDSDLAESDSDVRKANTSAFISVVFGVAATIVILATVLTGTIVNLSISDE